MFGKNFWNNVWSGVTRSVAFQLFGFALPYLAGLAVVMAGLLQEIPIAYALTAAFISFGALAAGLNQFSAWNNRLRDDQGIVAGPATYRLFTTDERHGNKKAFIIHIPILNRLNVPLKYSIKKTYIHFQKSDGTSRRENLAFRGEREGVIPAFDHRRPLLPAVIVEDLLEERRLDGRLEFELKFGRNQLRQTLRVHQKLVAMKQLNGEWTIQFLGS